MNTKYNYHCLESSLRGWRSSLARWLERSKTDPDCPLVIEGIKLSAERVDHWSLEMTVFFMKHRVAMRNVGYLV